MTILSSDSAVVRLEQKFLADISYKDEWVMDRLKWLNRLQALFTSLETFVDRKRSHVEKKNFLEALNNIRSVLPLEDPEEYYGKTNQAAISFRLVRDQFEEHLPEFPTWDNLFDVLLYQTVASQFVLDPPRPGTILPVQVETC